MFNTKARIIKDILWILALSGLIAAIFRLLFGLGPTTNLTDDVPWGLWKVFNMIAGVALSTSGFTVGFLVYVLRIKKFKPFLKPAILIAFLGYGCSCLALLFDIGIPFRFWHPIFMWNINSFLFEVFWCVLLYFTVTTIELAPTILDSTKAKKLSKFLHSVGLIAVVIGISLSSLHHSSLGSLFLVSPQRLHELWYTPRLPLHFILSAMAGGMFFIVLVKIVWSKIYNPESVFGVANQLETSELKSLNGSVCSISSKRIPGKDMKSLTKLSLIGSILLSVYLIIKIIDLIALGTFSALFSGTPESYLYIFELGIGVILPLAILLHPRNRSMPVPVGIAGFSASLGLIINRMNVGIFGYMSDAGHIYLPSLAEWALGIGVIAAAGLVFMAITENFPVFGDRPAKTYLNNIFMKGTGSLRQALNLVMSDSLHRVSLLGVFVLPLAFVFLYPNYSNSDSDNIMLSTGINAQRTVLKIDGNRQGYSTLFKHTDHQKRLGESGSCVKCHHLSFPGDYSTPCSECHRNMYESTSIFDHENHKVSITRMNRLVGINAENQSCIECHPLNSPKTAETAKKCIECHRENMFLNGKSNISFGTMQAVSYSDAMHITCVNCHKENAIAQNNEHLDKCYTCHLSLRKNLDSQFIEIAER